MSWPTWPAPTGPIPTAMANPIQTTILPTAINSAPSVMPTGLGYTQEQWTQMQQQNWQQWAQWQQQYQQWHQQYGAEYQKSMSAIQGSIGIAAQPPLPAMPNTGMPPPLPAENKPPLPPEDPPAIQQPSMVSYSTMPLNPLQQVAGYSTAPPPIISQPTQPPLPSQPADPYASQRQNWNSQSQTNMNNKRAYGQQTEFENAKRPLLERPPNQWSGQRSNQWSNQKPPQQTVSFHTQPPAQVQPKPNIEELSEAEKKFDKEFAAWEAQFNKWKEQNANHPDKTQYMEYEKKWESWRNSLLERREQMRRKRLAMVAGQASSKPYSNTQPPVTQQPMMDMTRAPPSVAPVQPLPSPVVNTAIAQPPSLTDNLIIKPPPHQNNEPLNFKPTATNTLPNEDTVNSSVGSGGEGFLKSSAASGGGIPGLDLVKEDDPTEPEKPNNEIDLAQEGAQENCTEPSQQPKRPDLDAISKGINTILGDQKLLSMLSMVSQNPPASPAPVATDSVSTITPQSAPMSEFTAPPPSQGRPPGYHFNEAPPPLGNIQPYNERSSHNLDNADLIYQPRESLNNFDDQTRSSFTMGPSDQESTGYPNKFPLPNNRFGPEARNNFRPKPANFPSDFPDNRRGIGPNRDDFTSDDFPEDNFRRGTFNRENSFIHNETFNKSDNYGNYGRGDNFQNDRPAYNDNLNRPNDNFNRPVVNNFRGGFNDRREFDDRRGNFGGIGDSFSSKFNSKVGPSRSSYDKQDDYENDNEEDDFEKYHSMFSEEDDNIQQGPSKGAQSRNMDRGGLGPRMGSQGPQSKIMDQGLGPRRMDQAYPQRRFDQGPLPRTRDTGPLPRLMDQGPVPRMMDQVPPPRMMDQGPPPRMMDQGPPPRMMDQGPPPRIMDEGPPPRMMDQGPPPRMMDQGPPPRMMDQGPNRVGQSPLRGMDVGPPPNMMDVPNVAELVPEKEAMFVPAVVIDYEHKSRNNLEPDVAIDPVHMFDYRHKPLNRISVSQRPNWLSETVRFIREFDPLASRVPPSIERPPPPSDRYGRDTHRDNWNQPDMLDDHYGPRGRNYHDERAAGRRYDNEYEEDRRPFHEDHFERDNAVRDGRRYGDNNHRFDRRQNDERNNLDFDELSDEEPNDFEMRNRQESRMDRSRSRSPLLSNPPNPAVTDITMIEDIINPPGRFNRPPRIVIILRGPPGSGKTYLAKLIKDKEAENGGSAPRILSLDDYFMVEHEKEVMEDGKKVKVKEMLYEYEAEMEDSYRSSFIKFFKKTITDGYFPFIIVDNVNDKVKYFGEMWSFAKQNGFQVYICQMDLDPVLCTKRNLHNRSQAEIEECIAGWEPTPSHHPTIEASGLLQASVISDVEMEEVEEQKQPEDDQKQEHQPEDQVRSKWDTFDCSINNLAKLDGVSKPLRPSRTMEEYLQLEGDWLESKPTKPGQKRVRWADLEEQREQKKMKAIGFVVGHTNWDRMMDPTEGTSALTRTRYIDRVGRY